MNNFSIENVVPANADWKPQKTVIYSVQGLGKTTFGSTFDAPIIARSEDGAAAIDVPTFPDIIKDFSNMTDIITALHGEHPYKTLLLDSLDWLEPIVHQKQIDSKPFSEKGTEIKTIEDYGYGKGYKMALDWWRYIMGGLDSLRLKRGMAIVLIAHSEIKRYDSPDSDPYDRYGIKLQKGAFGLWQEWADMVLFCNYKKRIHSADVGYNKEVKRADGSGDRVIYTEERPAFLAKNRWGLPPEIFIGKDKAWSSFHKELNKCTDGKYEIPNQPTEKKGSKK